MADQVILSATGLTKRFGAITVVDDVSFDVHHREVLGVLGPNGAGKTTLFNLISGDLAANGGALSLDGVPLGTEPPYMRCKRGIGRTYQVPQPFGAMTAFENLLVPAMFGAELPVAEAHDFCAEILEDCGLLPRANLQAGSLTLLDRKRLEMARALAGRPKLLLLDEIAGGLTDAEGAELVQLVARVRDRGVTVIWIEHVLHALMAVADRVMVLNFGVKIAEDTPKAVMANPEVQRVYMGIEG
ncbi:ABC transporter ATP-binding protein [Actibacterium lipolyticum]|uniref:Lipopolysaccharide export system ATP-binding protein LptB n=1 Tax=Actibacterium lipolyticum TaxID=1524263 RepID=A0A238L825_9RHOB|nr:ABC transporter ATP-binding protein [Actibacterium lipolyticum]SMX51158.1 Lipopolysaccharide export system ATP-binding protein LptB [Actibacterium lipolyticum]